VLAVHERQGPGPEDGSKRQIAIKMRKEVAAARWLPSQSCRIERRGLDREKDKIMPAGEVTSSRLRYLCRCREVDVTVGVIDRRSAEDAGALRLPPQGSVQYFEDEPAGSHGGSVKRPVITDQARLRRDLLDNLSKRS
jgi:hypothetical protein